MNELFEHLRRVTDDLDRAGVRYALVGGMAVSLRVEPRFTRDLDIAVAVNSDDEAEALGGLLMGLGYRTAVQVEHEAAKRMATLRMTPPRDSRVVVDFLFASCGIEPEIVAAAERIEALPGWRPPVARAEHLVAMKLLASDARRPQDMVDAQALLATMTREQIDRTREAIALIEQRGYHRRKNLSDDFERLLQSDRGD